MLPILVVFIFSSPNFEKRFQPSKTEISTMEDFDFRMIHWRAVIETIQSNSLLFGSGTKGDRDYLYNKYREYKLTSAYEEKYNAHNQFLEIPLNHGVLGLLFFLFFLGYIIKPLLFHKKYFYISIMLVFIIYMLTESILVRHSGIVLFSLIATIAIYCSTPYKIDKHDI
jgi:O-antigen ligase